MVETKKEVSELISEGFDHQQLGRFEPARRAYEQAIELEPNCFDALHLLGVLYAQFRDFDRAIHFFRSALTVEPSNPFVLFNRANAYGNLGMHDLALADLDFALALQPDNAEGLLTKGSSLKALGRNEDALACLDHLIKICPEFAKAHNNRGVVLKSLKRTTEALSSYAEAIALEPKYVDAFNNLGILLMDLGHSQQGVDSFDLAIALDPQNAEALNNRGNALNDLKRFEEALLSFDLAIAIKPDYAEAYSNRGNSLKWLMRLEESMASYDTAISLNDKLAEAYNGRGVLLQECGKLEEALECVEKAIALGENYADAVGNRANVLSEMRRFDQAFEGYESVIKDSPTNLRARWNRGLLCLLLGNYKAGWPLYENRWEKELCGIKRDLQSPEWLGEGVLEGKTVLLYAEQGLGDVIQFCRYASLVKKLAARVVLEVYPPLMGLLQGLDGVDELVEVGKPLPDFDYHCPLLSLPLAFRTELHNIPSPTPYLRADPLRASHWAKRLSGHKGLKVGVVWNGGFRPNKPELWGVNQRRNIELAAFAAALSEVDVDFFCLQKGDPAESEIRGSEGIFWPKNNFYNFASELSDFSDTAALIANLDLVISVDTSTAHVAAAMGKTTWILNRFDTCWRWLLDRQDSPWYDSVRLYRQDETRDWGPVLWRVAKDLSELASRKVSRN